MTDWDQLQSVASAIVVPSDVEEARKILGIAKNAGYEEVFSKCVEMYNVSRNEVLLLLVFASL